MILNFVLDFILSEIKILEEINELLNERHDIKSQYKALNGQFRDLKNSEEKRKEKVSC